MPNKINNLHDKFFRASLQYPTVAREFLEMYLPDEIKKELDFSSINYCQNSFIDEQLKLCQSDVLFKATIAGCESYLYILAEHQSKPDKLMPFRLMKYMVNIWDTHIKEVGAKQSLPLPAIFPLVFYTGGSKYNASRTLWDLCGDNAEMMHKILQSPFHLVDVNTLSEEELTSHAWAGTMGFIMRQHFKKNLTHELKKIVANFNVIALNQEGQYVLELINYILNMDDDHRDFKEFVAIIHDQLEPSVERTIMTLAQRIRDEGLEKGKLEEKNEIALNMLKEGSDAVFVAKVTKLSLDQVKMLQSKK